MTLVISAFVIWGDFRILQARIHSTMSVISYPVVYYTFPSEQVIGMIPGAGHQLVERDLKTLKSKFLDFLQRDYKKTGFYPAFDIQEPKVKVIEVKIRPSYKDQSGNYPLSETIKVPVLAIYGDTGQGHFECFLPGLEEVFYYYDPKQFKAIFTHFCVSIFNSYSPDKLYHYLSMEMPKVDFIKLRIIENRVVNEQRFMQEVRLEYLDQLAVKLPAPRRNKTRQQLPDAAWELDDKVGEIMDKVMIGKTNVLVIGESGVGKSAALRLVIRKLSAPSRPAGDRSFWEMRAQRFVAKAKYMGEWQEICEAIIRDLAKINGTLYLLDVVRLLQIGGASAEVSVAAFLQDFLQTGELTIIGELTITELDSIRKRLPGFVENFQLVRIEELPKPKVQSVFRQFADYVEQQMSIKVSEEALSEIYRLLYRYAPYEKFPGKGIKFLAKAISGARLKGGRRITRRDVLNQFVEETGMPELFLRDDLRLNTEELHDYFSNQIIGQPQVLDQLAGIVKVFKAGLNNPYKPIQTLLFAGPTGVGKTASAKALANYFFGKGQKQTPLVRIEMSEFQHPSQLSKFIGSGNEVGALVKNIRERPFSVLLLDEVEKAHPAIFDALMTVLDEGMMVDNFGRITNFRNSIIIMTSNIGASNIKAIGFSENSGEKVYQAAIEKKFRPEFVNRIDGMVFFNNLDPVSILKICRKELKALEKREGFFKRKITLEFTEAIIAFIAKVGYDHRYGARPLQRAIAIHITEKLAIYLLENPKLSKATLHLDYQNEVIINQF